jgi:NAD(P)-dependent dehydrogenase (short-subunit alcohol dehydrogenase family)
MMARALALNGASKVYIIGRRLSVLQDAANSINSAIVIPLQGDVTSQSSLLNIAAIVEKESGFINLLIANAGIMGPRPLSLTSSPPPSVAEYRAHALNTSMEEFTNTYAVNSTSVYYTALAFLELLDAGNTASHVPTRSQIIATSSIGGFSRLVGGSFAYSTSKAAVTHMMKMLATAFVPFKIRCNVLAPGLFPSELADGVIASLTNEEGKVDAKVIPAERTGTEEDVAGAVLYMAGRAGAYLNGSVIVVDGGRLGVLPSTY